jgi:DNA-binding LytR/AlgR family response regulator
MQMHEIRVDIYQKAQRWSAGAAAGLVALAFLYCYGWAVLAGTPASAAQSIGWALADWGIWLAGAPFLARRAVGLVAPDGKLPGAIPRLARDVLIVVLAALALRGLVGLAIGENHLAFLLFKRFPVYVVLGGVITGVACWLARPHTVLLVRAPAADAEPKLAVQSAKGEHLVAVAEVDCIEACGNYLEVRAAGSTYLMRCTMKALEAQLAGTRLARCHRSFFVNLDKVERLELRDSGNHALLLAGGREVPLSKAYRDGVRASLRPG